MGERVRKGWREKNTKGKDQNQEESHIIRLPGEKNRKKSPMLLASWV